MRFSSSGTCCVLHAGPESKLCCVLQEKTCLTSVRVLPVLPGASLELTNLRVKALVRRGKALGGKAQHAEALQVTLVWCQSQRNEAHAEETGGAPHL